MSHQPIHEKLVPFVQAATDAGYTVHVPVVSVRPGQVGFVYVTRENDPGIALMQIPTFPDFEPISVDVPVKPNRTYGSAVVQDHDGTIPGVLALLDVLMRRSAVIPRFIRETLLVPVDRRIPADAVVYA